MNVVRLGLAGLGSIPASEDKSVGSRLGQRGREVPRRDVMTPESNMIDRWLPPDRVATEGGSGLPAACILERHLNPARRATIHPRVGSRNWCSTRPSRPCSSPFDGPRRSSSLAATELEAEAPRWSGSGDPLDSKDPGGRGPSAQRGIAHPLGRPGDAFDAVPVEVEGQSRRPAEQFVPEQSIGKQGDQQGVLGEEEHHRRERHDPRPPPDANRGNRRQHGDEEQHGHQRDAGHQHEDRRPAEERPGEGADGGDDRDPGERHRRATKRPGRPGGVRRFGRGRRIGRDERSSAFLATCSTGRFERMQALEAVPHRG